jgi:hypothetical protein
LALVLDRDAFLKAIFAKVFIDLKINFSLYIIRQKYFRKIVLENSDNQQEKESP